MQTRQECTSHMGMAKVCRHNTEEKSALVAALGKGPQAMAARNVRDSAAERFLLSNRMAGPASATALPLQ